MDEFSKMLLRKFRKIKYENVDLIPEYEDREREYKAIRESLDMIESIIKNLSNYEHGNQMYKSFKRGMQYISDRASLNMYKNMDIYEEAAAVGENVKKINGSSKYQSIGQKYYESFNSIAKSKKSLNNRLAVIKVKAKEIKNQIQEIDHQRKKVKNMRYDLEVLLQDGGYNEEIRDVEKKEYENQSKSVLKNMKQFIEENDVPKILKDMSMEYKKHMEEVVESLRPVG